MSGGGRPRHGRMIRADLDAAFIIWAVASAAGKLKIGCWDESLTQINVRSWRQAQHSRRLSLKMCWQYGNWKSKLPFSSISSYGNICSLYQWPFLQGEWLRFSLRCSLCAFWAEILDSYFLFSYYKECGREHCYIPKIYSSAEANLCGIANLTIRGPEWASRRSSLFMQAK